MKNPSRASLVLPAGAVIAVIVALGYILFGRGGASERSDEDVTLRSSRRIASAERQADRKARADRIRDRRRAKAEKVKERPAPVKPDFLADLEADRKMTAEMKKLFLDLQAALDLDNAKRVYALVHKLQLMDEWPDGIPRAVKLKALQALSWFGAAGMAEAVGFLADSDPEVRQVTQEEFERMLSDSWELGDVKLAEVIKTASKFIHDRDALDAFYYELNNMRPTIKAETALAICDSGNPDAVAALEDSLEFVFDTADVEVRTREDIELYRENALRDYEENPEKVQEDEDFYGPFKK